MKWWPNLKQWPPHTAKYKMPKNHSYMILVHKWYNQKLKFNPIPYFVRNWIFLSVLHAERLSCILKNISPQRAFDIHMAPL